MYSSSSKHSSSESSPLIAPPSITEVVERYGVPLRRSGKEYIALCPLHSEKTPSFYLNEDKGVFHCWGCGEGGDVFDFVMQIEGVDFKGALVHLGLAGTSYISKPRKSKQRIVAEVISAWAEEMSLTLSARMRVLARGMSDEKRDDYCSRQWGILEVLDEDLTNPRLLPKLWEERQSVEGIINGR